MDPYEEWEEEDRAAIAEWHANTKRVPTVSQWQRFWRSPWTWLAFSIYQVVWTIPTNHGWSLAFAWIFFALFVGMFCVRADERWGKP
jgi:hypothetical protein